MPTLLLNRQCRIIDPESTAATVVTEPRANVSRGWCARITPDPSGPIGLWDRAYLEGTPDVLDGRAVIAFAGLPRGHYEAHSTLLSRKAQSVYFEVAEGGGIEILGGQGDEGLVIARLNRMTLDELVDARAASRTQGDGLPPLDGSLKQVAWAERLREQLIRALEQSGALDLVDRVLAVRDATWFIANRDRPLTALLERLRA
jgi:hypothetical protein